MAQLSEWLQLMLAEISRQREDAARAREELQWREREAAESNPAPLPRRVNDSSATRR